MACEVPVFATIVGGLSEVVTHGADGDHSSRAMWLLPPNYALDKLPADCGRAMPQSAALTRGDNTARMTSPVDQALSRRC